MPRIEAGARTAPNLMPGSEPPDTVEAVETSQDPSAPSDLLDLVAELRGELQSLRGEVVDLRGRLENDATAAADPGEPEVPASRLEPLDPALAILDAESFSAELDMAIAHPLPAELDMGTDDVEVVVDLVELAEQQAEALRLHPELSDVIEAIEEQMAGSIPSNMSGASLEPDSDISEGLSAEEIDALFSATAQMGMSAKTVETEVTQPEPSPPPSAAPPAPAGGTMMSEEEIMNLLAEAKGDPRVIPVDPQTSVAPPEPSADLVSADEIKAMLGVKDTADDSAPESVPPSDPIVVEPELRVDEPVELRIAEPEPPFSEDDTEIDLDHVDPSAVARVPGELAAMALALPVCLVGDKLHCLCIEPFDLEALGSIAQSIGLEVVPHSGEPLKVLAEIRTRYGVLDEAVARVPQPTPAPNMVSRLIGKVLRKSA